MRGIIILSWLTQPDAQSAHRRFHVYPRTRGQLASNVLEIYSTSKVRWRRFLLYINRLNSCTAPRSRIISSIPARFRCFRLLTLRRSEGASRLFFSGTSVVGRSLNQHGPPATRQYSDHPASKRPGVGARSAARRWYDEYSTFRHDSS